MCHLLGEHLPYGGTNISCLTPLLGPRLPESRSPVSSLAWAQRCLLFVFPMTGSCDCFIRPPGFLGLSSQCLCCGGAAFHFKTPHPSIFPTESHALQLILLYSFSHSLFSVCYPLGLWEPKNTDVQDSSALPPRSFQSSGRSREGTNRQELEHATSYRPYVC